MTIHVDLSLSRATFDRLWLSFVEESRSKRLLCPEFQHYIIKIQVIALQLFWVMAWLSQTIKVLQMS